MTNEFIREARYAVLKSADVMQCLTVSELIELRRIQAKVEEHRAEIGKPPLDCVVVESDWPEYEQTWRAIEARVAGAQPAPTEQDESVRKSWARFSHELHRRSDAPYPGMADAFEQHFSQSFIDREWRVEASTWAAAWKAAKRHGAQPALSVPDDVVEQAVNRFLSWKLPKDFHPDGGMVFIPTKGRDYDSPHWPVGTNLLNAQQAREMLRYVLAAAPESKP